MNFLVAQGHGQVAEEFQKESGTMPQVDLASITDRLAVIKAIQCGNVEAYLEELEDTIGILGYEDPLTCPRNKDLLDKSRWCKTASNVNGALLTSQTGEKGPKLHSLLKMLVLIQDELDDIAVYPRMSICPLASS